MLLPILLLLCWMPLVAMAGPNITLEQGEICLHAGSQPPRQACNWQPVTLPDHWTSTHPQYHGEAWYRFNFAYSAPDEQLQAIYLSRLSMNAAIWLNGVPIGNGGSFSEPVGRNWNRPLLFIVPHGLLRSGSNQLLIRLLAPPWTQGVLMPPQIGPELLLRDEYENTHFLRITINQSTSLLIAAIGLLMLSLWWRRRKDVAYALFGMAALLWAAQSANLFLRQAPLPTRLWEVLINSSFSLIASLMMMALLRFTGARQTLLCRLLLLQALIAPIAMSMAPQEWFLNVSAACHLITVLATAATLLQLVRMAFLRAQQDARMLLLSLSMVLIFAIHDWLMHSKPSWLADWLQWGHHESFLLQFAAPLLFICVAWIMTTRYVRVLNDYERLNAELEQRVHSKHQELEANFARIEQILKEQAMLEERERIYQDLHDDFGAKLLSLVYRAENPDNAELARSALQDLRDVVSRTTEDAGLDILCADWRAECEKRLRDGHIRLDWQVRGLLSLYRLSQPQALNLGRILREAVSNILRHSEASQVTISLQVDPLHLTLEIIDNGKGLPLQRGRITGRGFANMEKRALRLQAQLYRLSTLPQGLTLHLVMQLQKKNQRPPAIPV